MVMPRKTLLEKLIILNRARKTGNVAETCRDFGISRISYYHMKKTVGAFVRESRSPQPDDAIESEIVIAEMALSYPDLSNLELSKKLLADHGIQLSHTTVRNKLMAMDLNRDEQRWRHLEDELKYGDAGRELSVRQRRFIAKYNPCFSAYRSGLGRPFEQLSLDVIKVGAGRFCLAVDPAANYAFALLLAKMDRARIINWLDAEVFPRAAQWNLPVKTAAASALKVFDENLDGESDYDAFRELLGRHNIKRVDQTAIKPELDGSVQHVYDLALPLLDEFAAQALDEQAAAEKLAAWVDEYNRHYEHPYYPSYGLSPLAMIEYYLKHGENWRGVHSLKSRLRGYISPMPTLSVKRPAPAHHKQVNSVYSSLVSLFFK